MKVTRQSNVHTLVRSRLSCYGRADACPALEWRARAVSQSPRRWPPAPTLRGSGNLLDLVFNLQIPTGQDMQSDERAAQLEHASVSECVYWNKLLQNCSTPQVLCNVVLYCIYCIILCLRSMMKYVMFNMFRFSVVSNCVICLTYGILGIQHHHHRSWAVEYCIRLFVHCLSDYLF